MNTFRFTGKVTKYSKEDYLEAIRRYVDKIKKNPYVVSVYQIGSFKYPGLSDIDLVIVLSDNVESFSWNDYSVTETYNSDMFMHESFLIQESLMEEIKFLYPLFGLKHIWGKEFRFKEPGLNNFVHFFIQEFIIGYMAWPDRILKKKTAKIKKPIS